MPQYNVDVTVSAQTARASAASSTVEVEERVIRSVVLFIDPGANGEVETGLFYGDRRIAPDPNGSPMSTPAQPRQLPVNVQLPGVPTDLEVLAWAPDADFGHEVLAEIETADPEDVAEEVRVISIEDDTPVRRADQSPSAEEVRQSGDTS